jgi:hypothetical protein
MNAHRSAYAGGYHARSRVSSRQDSDSNDHSSKSGGDERDARNLDAGDTQTPSSNKLAMGRESQSPTSTLGGLTQASERDASMGQANRTFNDAPNFSPSR